MSTWESVERLQQQAARAATGHDETYIEEAGMAAVENRLAVEPDAIQSVLDRVRQQARVAARAKLRKANR